LKESAISLKKAIVIIFGNLTLVDFSSFTHSGLILKICSSTFVSSKRISEEARGRETGFCEVTGNWAEIGARSRRDRRVVGLSVTFETDGSIFISEK